MKNMKDLFDELTFRGYATSRADEDFGAAFTVWDEYVCMSVSFTPRNNCSNRPVDFGWASEDAEVMIWSRIAPFSTIPGPDGGVWNSQSVTQVLDLVLKYLEAPA